MFRFGFFGYLISFIFCWLLVKSGLELDIGQSSINPRPVGVFFLLPVCYFIFNYFITLVITIGTQGVCCSERVGS